MLSILITNIVLNRFHSYEDSRSQFSFGQLTDAIWDGRYALLVPFIILGGIYSGIFTPTEAAAVAVVTTIVIGLVIGTLRVSDFPDMLASSAKVNGVILPTVALSLPLAEALGTLSIPQYLIEKVLSWTDQPMVIILVMVGAMIAAGCVMEAVPNIVLIAPVLLPLAREIGMHDIHFCIIVVTSLGIGFITPPIGLNLFVISGVTGQPVLSVARRAVPYVFSMLMVALILAFVPQLSLILIE